MNGAKRNMLHQAQPHKSTWRTLRSLSLTARSRRPGVGIRQYSETEAGGRSEDEEEGARKRRRRGLVRSWILTSCLRHRLDHQVKRRRRGLVS